MAISKIVYKETAQSSPVTWMDATTATAEASDILSPKTAMLADGVMTTGTGSGGGSSAVTGTITAQSGGATISFGATFSSYLFFIEMTDASKTALVNTGNTNSRTYAFTGMYPSPNINNSAPGNCMTTYRVKPSTLEFVYSQTSINASTGTSSINISTADLNGGANYMYIGYTYNYTIIPLS